MLNYNTTSLVRAEGVARKTPSAHGRGKPNPYAGEGIALYTNIWFLSAQKHVLVEVI